MNEREWLDCADPERLVDFLQEGVSERKLRLFAVACCRRIWEQVGKDGRKAVDAAESYAEGRGTPEDLRRANRQPAPGHTRRKWWSRQDDRLAFAARAAFSAAVTDPGTVEEAARFAALSLALGAIERLTSGRSLPLWGVHADGLRLQWRGVGRGKQGKETKRQWRQRVTRRANDAWWSERKEQADLLRCLLGNPFRPVSLDPRWLTLTVASIAQTCHDERSFADLPVLADALEDAGCSEAAILDHCREVGPHARGCWLVDLIRLSGTPGARPSNLVE
jgi:hypothetical protein